MTQTAPTPTTLEDLTTEHPGQPEDGPNAHDERLADFLREAADYYGQAPDQTFLPFSFEELTLASRNRSMPLEAMVYDTTPVGLHYLLIHYTIPVADEARWQIALDGAVARPRSLSMADIRARPRVTMPVTMECAGDGRTRLKPRPLNMPWVLGAMGTAEWTGTPVWPLLEEAGIRDDAVEVVFYGADRGIGDEGEEAFARSLTLEELRRPEVILAYEMNGRPLEPQHGYPVRLLVPGWYGMTSVKWLARMDAVLEPFGGGEQIGFQYQRDDDDPGEPVSRQRVRALMIPPGTSNFWYRQRRFVEAGTVELTGRAWSGVAPVARVEVGIDGRWADAELGPSLGDFAWRRWRFPWHATPGEHELACRATDAAGRVQPLEQPWNTGGFGVNHVQRVNVTVR
jgi:DMSO/TMAO reductase YedYZ molybdopterin-dependent catalytic subunit